MLCFIWQFFERPFSKALTLPKVQTLPKALTLPKA
jgi:hypothetical protein